MEGRMTSHCLVSNSFMLQNSFNPRVSLNMDSFYLNIDSESDLRPFYKTIFHQFDDEWIDRGKNTYLSVFHMSDLGLDCQDGVK
ncbi:hypothetical protein P8452_36828 [Trifolium repens]|nr:hypothetical protein P8452_36828 [Trifolium repens]